MLKVVGQFRLHYKGQGQGNLGNLVVAPSLLRRVIESHGRDIEIMSIRDHVLSDIGDELSDIGDEGWPFTHMVVFGIRDGLWFPSQKI